MLRLSGPSGHSWINAVLLLLFCLTAMTLVAAQSCSVDVSTNPFSPAAGQAMTVNATLNSSGGPILTAQVIGGGGGTADVSYDGANICSSFSNSCSTTIDPGSPGLHNLSWSCSDSNGSNSGSQTVQVTSPGPTPTPTPTGTSGGIGPKYVVLAVTYAPPGSQSTVNYSNSTMLGTSLSLNNTLTDQISETVTLGSKIQDIFGFIQNTGTTAVSFTQQQDTSLSIAINETRTRSTTIRGPSSSGIGLSHDADIIWLWLNPVLNLTVTSPTSLQWNELDFDPRDPVGGVDVFGIQVKFLNGHAPIPSDIADVLARRWAPNTADGSGPGLTAADFAQILKADPFSDPAYTVNVPTGSECTSDGRFCRVDNVNFQYAPPPPGEQPITEALTLTHQATATQGQAVTQTFQVAFSAAFAVDSSSFIGGFISQIKDSRSLTLTDKFNATSTQQVGQTAALSVTGPTAADNYTGPVEFNVFQDNIYGSFMFAFVTEPTFNLSASPGSQNITAGQCASYTAMVSALVSGFNSTITLSATGAPSGATQSLSPASITGAGSSTLMICTASSTAQGSYAITINAASGQEAHSTIVTLTVGPPPDFALSTTPSSQTVVRGQSATYTISVQALNGFNGNVSITLGGLPSAASASFNPASINSSGSSTLVIATTSSMATGTYSLTITGTSGSLIHSVPISLTVNASAPPPPPPPPPPPDPCDDPNSVSKDGSPCIFQIQ